MRKLIFIVLAVAFLSCEKEPKNQPCPSAPYGTHDETDNYNSGEYSSVTYTYYCHNGRYISVSYTRTCDHCGWKKDEFTSSGICD